MDRRPQTEPPAHARRCVAAAARSSPAVDGRVWGLPQQRLVRQSQLDLGPRGCAARFRTCLLATQLHHGQGHLSTHWQFHHITTSLRAPVHAIPLCILLSNTPTSPWPPSSSPISSAQSV